jgi:dihydrolipoamide dehydrogenase
MLGYKDDVIGQNTKGIEFLFKKNKVTWLKGWASIPAAGQVKVGDEVHRRRTSSSPPGPNPPLPGVRSTKKTIVTSTGALELEGDPQAIWW